ncbi:Pentatricopeptide repeat-containing protein [Camellia lanceoleosa]|uniref:Pentatricopeptide repeat-containing protein n=1 Tax=Camellia lanceoleosa TaxID=1840588 RepID=A0ACC0FKS5_9ERIC|nr:Pentatricopeptide repeat-containing protein [Camellia lanceoleosa]
MDYASSIFQQIDEPGSFAFNHMIRGHVKDMNLEEALLMYDEMLELGVEPDNFTYPTLLKACANLPALEEGMQIHGHSFKLGFEDDVFVQNSLINMYGKCGEIGLSCAVFEKMEQRTVASWSALIAAHANLGLWCECLEIFGEMSREGCWRVEESVLVNVLSACTHLGALDLGSDYVVMSNMYAQAQMWHEVAKIRKEMVSKGLTQIPGFSLVEVKRKVYKFVSQDKSYPQCQGIYEMIHQMEWQLRFEGYSPDTSQVLLGVDEEEKRQRLSSHSQKLAIAFSLIHTSQGSRVRIVKNIRMCSDCHTYTKFISTVYEREIIVRDRNRFHRFKDGSCSCRDYW